MLVRPFLPSLDSICTNCLHQIARSQPSTRSYSSTASLRLAGHLMTSNRLAKSLKRSDRSWNFTSSRKQSTKADPPDISANERRQKRVKELVAQFRAENKTKGEEQRRKKGPAIYSVRELSKIRKEKDIRDQVPPDTKTLHSIRTPQGKETPRPSEQAISSVQDDIGPQDASSRLTTISHALPEQSFKRKFTTYLSLSKPRLTFLIILTSTAAYGMYPVPAMLDPAAAAVPSLSPITLLFLTTGTFLTCASANALNMLFEPQYDALMSRTRNRPLVRGLLTKRAALIFAILTGTLGTAGLYFGVNPTTAFLAAANIGLYAFVYTPLKRIHPINTWVGAVVGAIPPLMGWTAAAGQTASESGDWHELLFGPDSRGGWALAALLFLWQIPHFAALSWTIRHEYAAAGYKMLCSSRPRLDAFFALGCSALLPATIVQLYTAGVVDSWAVVASGPVSFWMVWRSLEFVKLQGAKGSARSLFWASVWYLPIVLVLGMVGKKGLWDRVVASWRGEEFDEEDDEWEYEAPVLQQERQQAGEILPQKQREA
ncbi:protoheme IX farnesyltransferase [Microthyrium microscopicum]|uniref:Protoheme IX farnesyltransferase, mitochondrial n=1 Tax=Microthyrium microscopicum TaxID=703497 RepID=A0A6A6U6S9_9PEZI|nr:protoheme IX farnesyltransferase [Microthyrium microscopicum]